MSCELLNIVTDAVKGLEPYIPGKSIEELQREIGLDNIVKLASNENPLGLSSKVIEKIALTKELSRYPDGNGLSLKKILADKHNVDIDQVTLGNGSNDILDIVARTFADAEHQVIYSQYSFLVYKIVTQAVNAKHIVVPALEWGYDLNAMLASVTDSTRLVFIANPNNPTGTWIKTHDMRHLLENMPERVIVLIDEAYFEYAKADNSYPNTSLWLSDYSNLIVTRTFSKAYGLAGLRIGYALSSSKIANLLNRVRQPFNNNSLALLCAESVLNDDDYLKNSIEVNEEGMKQLIFAFDKMGLQYISSKGNFISVDFGFSAENVYQELLKKGIIVRPLFNYDMPNHLRISIGLKSENKLLISALNEIL